MNTFRTTILLAVLTALLMWIGNMLGGGQGAIIALLIAGGINFFSYWFSDKIVLKMYGGQEVGPQDDPELYGMVQDLAQRAGLPMPKVYLLPQDTPNAFATGRNPEHAAVAVTDGIRRILNKRELAGVLGHELSHVKHRYSREHDRGDPGRRDRLSGANGAVGDDLRRQSRPRRRGRWQYLWAYRHDDRRADRGDADPNGCVAL